MRERTLPALALLLVLLVPLFAGCLGDKKGGAKAETDKGFEFVPPPVEKKDDENVTTNTTDLYTPKAHFHHYWGEGDGVDYVSIYEGDVEFEQFPPSRHADNYNRPLGYAEFDLESDGDDVSSGEGDAPISPVTSKADAVFAGTSHLIVNLSWAKSGDHALQKTGVLRLRYQPACSPIFQPFENAGLPVEIAEETDTQVTALPIRIPVSPQCADPPHQIAVSRWRFVVLSYPDEGMDALNSVVPNPPSVAMGWINVVIHAQNGGLKAIGEPHPDLFEGQPELQLGEPMQGTFRLRLGGEQPEVRNPQSGDRITERQCTRLQGSERDRDIELPTRFIVPFQTKELQFVVTLAYDAAANDNIPEAQAGQVRLLYKPANNTTYSVAHGFSGSGGSGEQTYTIAIRYDPANKIYDQSMTDPVYNVESDWRFGFTVFSDVGGSLKPCVGTWAGSYTITVKAIRNPDIRIF